MAISLAIAAAVATAEAQKGRETFAGTATVATAAGATATAPVTIVVDRLLSADEATTLADALSRGGPAALRKALSGVPPTGSIRVGNSSPTPTRLTIERITDGGRLLTIVTDQPILFVGAALPGAKPKEGYDFAVLDIQVDSAGAGSGMLAPAAKIRASQGVFVVEDYGAESVRITGVTKAK